MIDFSIVISSSNYNGSMWAKFFTKNKVLDTITTFQTGKNIFDFRFKLPNKLYIQVGGKDPTTDTVVDDNGKILFDKYLTIDQICIDHKPLDPNVLHKICRFHATNTDQYNSTYMSFNGYMTIDFPYQNSLLTHLYLNKLLGN